MSGEFGYCVCAKKRIDWISRVCSSCWHGWLGVELITKMHGRIFYKKFAVFCFESLNFFAALPMINVITE